MPPGRTRALLAEAALQGASLLFFSAQDFDIAKGVVLAESWTPAGFLRGAVPLPDVVLLAERAWDGSADPLLQCLARSMPVIVDSLPDKTGQAQALLATPLARHVIPFVELDAAGAAATLTTFLAAEGSAVVKSVNGKRGGGLHFILCDDAGRWVVRYDEAVIQTTLDGAVEEVCRRIAGRQAYRRYIAQRYLQSLSADGRALDLRMHVQRDGTGDWGLTRGYVRLGEHGMPMSNVNRGGYQGDLAAFARRRGRPALEVEWAGLAIDVARALEAGLGLRLSDLGVDLLLDPAGHPWVIEVNTHPGTSLHEHARAERVIGYALHLAQASRGLG
jgi:hypothetical protein